MPREQPGWRAEQKGKVPHVPLFPRKHRRVSLIPGMYYPIEPSILSLSVPFFFGFDKVNSANLQGVSEAVSRLQQ